MKYTYKLTKITEIVDYYKEYFNIVEFVNFEFSGPYVYGQGYVGTNNVSDLKDKSLTKGIVATHPGWIILELNKEWEFSEIEIAGYNGNTTAFAVSNGANCQILTSKDKSNWTTVGTIPANYGAYIQKVRLTKTTAKYIKFQHTSYLGIGYLDVLKLA
jgi:hypothetical protein